MIRKKEEEPVEEIIDINPKPNYWKFFGFLASAVIFGAGYCLGNGCLSGENNNLFGRVLGSANSLINSGVTLTNEAFSNIFESGSREENPVQTIDLNKKNQSETVVLRETGNNKELPSLGDSQKPQVGAVKTQERPPVFKECSFDAARIPKHDRVIINEVAWMGERGNSRHEWIELKNISIDDVDISNWQLIDAEGEIKIVFPGNSNIAEQEFYLLERGEEAVSTVKADYLYTGNLENEGDGLELFDLNCNLIDKVIASPTWPAGTASPKYLTAERGKDLVWHDYNGSGTSGIFGTPKAPNSEPKPLPPVTAGESQPVSTSPSGGSNPSSVSPPISASPLISEIMVGVEGNADYEFIELYNPSSTPIDLTGWSIKKKSSTGNESSLVVASRLEGKAIPAAKYFLLAREGGYSGEVVPDVWWPTSSTYALAYSNNSLLLYKLDGTLSEEINWSEIPKGQSYERESWSSNQFKPQSNPSPKSSLTN